MPTCNCPSIEEIIAINKEQISQFGGLIESAGVLQSGPSLEWALYAVQHEIYGVDRYPELEEKAALLCWKIAQHVFVDGNKRTALETLLYFLNLNGFTLDADGKELEDLITEVAPDGSYTHAKLTDWIRPRLVELEIREIEYFSEE